MILNMLLWLLFHWEGGGSKMAIVTVYVTLIIAGRRTYAQVPITLQPTVANELEAIGLGTDGQPQ